MNAYLYPLPGVFLILFVGAVLVALRRRGKPLSLSLLVWAGVPTGPQLTPLAYLFPGRGAPPDPNPRRSIAGAPNPHSDAHLPAGVTVKSDPPVKREI